MVSKIGRNEQQEQTEQPEETPGGGIEANEILAAFFCSIIVNGGVFRVPKEMLKAIGTDWPRYLKIKEKPSEWEFTVDDAFVLKKSKRNRQPRIVRP